eukprot:18690-Heterococcus_DN1.PRE.3
MVPTHTVRRKLHAIDTTWVFNEDCAPQHYMYYTIALVLAAAPHAACYSDLCVVQAACYTTLL